NAQVEFSPESDTLAQLLASASVLGADVQRAALRFFASRLQAQFDGNDDRTFFALAVAILVVHLERESRPADWLEQLGWWVLGCAAIGGPSSPSFVYWGQRYAVWQGLTQRMRQEVELMAPGDARDVLREVAGIITGG